MPVPFARQDALEGDLKILASRCPLSVGRVCAAFFVAAILYGLIYHSSIKGSFTLANPPQAAQSTVSNPSTVLPATISGVTIKVSGADETAVEISTSGNVPFHVLELEDPPRLVVDLEGAIKTTSRTLWSTKSQFIKRVRLSQFQEEAPAIVRVVADLTGHPTHDVAAIAGGIRITFRAPGVGQSSTRPSKNQGMKSTGQPSMGPITQPTLATPGQVNPNPQTPQVQVNPVQSNPPPPGAYFRKLPYNTLAQNEKLLDALGLRIVLSFNYKKGGPDEAPWKTKGAPGIEASRVFIKPLGPGSYRTAELGVAPSVQGGFELVAYGEQIDQANHAFNPDFPQIQQMINEEVTKAEQTPPPQDMNNLAYETYYLSYVVADRAIALLKTLGYTTVEYSTQAGESVNQIIFNPVKLGSGKPPIIVKLIDSSKTSLMDNPPPATPGAGAVAMPQQIMQPQVGVGAATSTGVPQIGGTYLFSMTSGEPQERLLILYDRNNPQELQNLLNLLQQTIDVPSRQILIDALVVEINKERIKDLGVTFNSTQNKSSLFSVDTDPVTGAPLPFTYTFDKLANGSNIAVATFKAELSALLQKNEAKLLSNPSVLVLDDRQARIQIGQQVPVIKQVNTAAGIISSVDYFPVGIVLNMRPRISDDSSEVTMQTETIVSAINTGATKALGTSAFLAPVVDNRQVQSIVRVSDNTPFIIGGLISTNDSTQVNGIPFLSDIPLLGALFRNSSTTTSQQEVIIVVTPHVVPMEDKYFSYIIPKDSDQFDRFKFGLFRNAYRIRGSDLYDLSFVYDSNVYKDLKAHVTTAVAANPDLKNNPTYASIVKGGVPGEDIMVKRMLWEIIDRTHYARYVSPDKIFFFDNDPSAPGGFHMAYLSQFLRGPKNQENDVAISFEAAPKGTEDRPFVPPKGVVTYPNLTPQNYLQTLTDGNDRNPDGTPKDWMVLLSRSKSGIMVRRNSVTPLELLQGVLVLKRLLQLNEPMPLTLSELHIGRQIIFPTPEELQQGYHVIDRETAKLFYEVYNYYPAFEQEFNRQTHLINTNLGVASNR